HLAGRVYFPAFEKNHIFIRFVRNISFQRIGKNEQWPFDIFIDFDAQVLWFIQRKLNLISIQLPFYIAAFGADIKIINRRKKSYFHIHLSIKRKISDGGGARIVNKNFLAVDFEFKFGSGRKVFGCSIIHQFIGKKRNTAYYKNNK